MYRALKLRLYPNKTQEQTLNKVLGCYRVVYNNMLDLKKNAYDKDKTNLSLKDLSKYFHHNLLNDSNFFYWKEQNTKVLNQAIRQMMTAYDNFFKSKKGFPKFKSKKDKNTALFPLDAISKKNTFEERKISLTTPLKDIKFRCSDLYFRRLKQYKNNIRRATLSKSKSGNFFLSILIDFPQEEFVKFRHTKSEVGIDLGIKDFVITSDGELFKNKHLIKNQEKLIKKLQKQLSHKVNGSKNKEKARIKLAKAYEKLTNQKENYIHYVVNELLTYYDVIYMEDLNVSGMLKNHNLSKAIQEVGFYRFKQVLSDKASNNYKRVIEVDRFYPSSKTCSCCGYKKTDLKLSDREWICPNCGTKHDRDVNAAMNILLEGQRLLNAV